MRRRSIYNSIVCSHMSIHAFWFVMKPEAFMAGAVTAFVVCNCDFIFVIVVLCLRHCFHLFSSRIVYLNIEIGNNGEDIDFYVLLYMI